MCGWLIASGSVGCADTECGAGTTLVGSQCVALSDASTTAPGVATAAADAAGDANGATTAPEVDPSVDSCDRIAVISLGSLPYDDGTTILPVGAIARFDTRCHGDEPGADWTTRLPSVAYTLVPDDGTARLLVRASQVSVVAQKEGLVRLRATVSGRSGSRSDESQIRVQGTADGQLLLKAVQDGAETHGSNYTFPDERDPPTLPLDLAARVSARWTWRVRDSLGHMWTYASDLDVRDVSLEILSGSGHIDSDGLVRSNEFGTVIVAGTVGPSEASGGETASTTIHFVPETAATGLAVFAAWPSSKRTNITAPSRSQGAPDPGPGELASLAALVVRRSGPFPVLQFGVEYTGPGVSYFRWQDSSKLALRANGTASATIERDGSVRWKSPGTTIWTATAGGFATSVLVQSHFPEDLGASLRIDPTMLSYQVPPEPGDPTVCSYVRLFVTEPGAAERELLGTEQLSVGLSFTSASPYASLIWTEALPLRVCPPRHYSLPRGTTSGVAQYSYLGLTATLPFSVAER